MKRMSRSSSLRPHGRISAPKQRPNERKQRQDKRLHVVENFNLDLEATLEERMSENDVSKGYTVQVQGLNDEYMSSVYEMSTILNDEEVWDSFLEQLPKYMRNYKKQATVAAVSNNSRRMTPSVEFKPQFWPKSAVHISAKRVFEVLAGSDALTSLHEIPGGYSGTKLISILADHDTPVPRASWMIKAIYLGRHKPDCVNGKWEDRQRNERQNVWTRRLLESLKYIKENMPTTSLKHFIYGMNLLYWQSHEDLLDMDIVQEWVTHEIMARSGPETVLKHLLQYAVLFFDKIDGDLLNACHDLMATMPVVADAAEALLHKLGIATRIKMEPHQLMDHAKCLVSIIDSLDGHDMSALLRDELSNDVLVCCVDWGVSEYRSGSHRQSVVVELLKHSNPDLILDLIDRHDLPLEYLIFVAYSLYQSGEFDVLAFMRTLVSRNLSKDEFYVRFLMEFPALDEMSKRERYNMLFSDPKHEIDRQDRLCEDISAIIDSGSEWMTQTWGPQNEEDTLKAMHGMPYHDRTMVASYIELRFARIRDEWTTVMTVLKVLCVLGIESSLRKVVGIIIHCASASGTLPPDGVLAVTMASAIALRLTDVHIARPSLPPALSTWASLWRAGAVSSNDDDMIKLSFDAIIHGRLKEFWLENALTYNGDLAQCIEHGFEMAIGTPNLSNVFTFAVACGFVDPIRVFSRVPVSLLATTGLSVVDSVVLDSLKNDYWACGKTSPDMIESLCSIESLEPWMKHAIVSSAFVPDITCAQITLDSPLSFVTMRWLSASLHYGGVTVDVLWNKYMIDAKNDTLEYLAHVLQSAPEHVRIGVADRIMARVGKGCLEAWLFNVSLIASLPISEHELLTGLVSWIKSIDTNVASTRHGWLRLEACLQSWTYLVMSSPIHDDIGQAVIKFLGVWNGVRGDEGLIVTANLNCIASLYDWVPPPIHTRIHPQSPWLVMEGSDDHGEVLDAVCIPRSFTVTEADVLLADEDQEKIVSIVGM